jgi:hypothetical protein
MGGVGSGRRKLAFADADESTYVADWQAKLRSNAVFLTEDHAELFSQVCGQIKAWSDEIRQTGLVIDGEPNPLIDQMRLLEQGSLVAFREYGYTIKDEPNQWPALSMIYEVMVNGILDPF